MAPVETESLIRTGYEHLARFAFHTRDNPFLNWRASLSFEETDHEDLRQLLDGEVRLGDWLETKPAESLLRRVRVGSVPRDVDILVRDGEKVVGVDSVHAFLHAPLFWWLTSILWCIAVSRSANPLLSDGVLGFRFDEHFLEDPSRAGLMFEDQKAAQKSWREFPEEVRKKHPGEDLTNATLDLRAFYYSIDAGPRQILRTFFAGAGRRVPQTRHLRVLTGLLEALHSRYAELCGPIAPRVGYLEEEGASPLPIGLPSSQVLGNMIISRVLDEMEGVDGAVGVAAYADDITVMTERLLELREKPAAFLARIGICEGEAPYRLRCEATKAIGFLATAEEKMAVSYGRYLPPEDEEEERSRKSFLRKIGLEEERMTSFGDDNADWGGRLGTVLRSANKRERVPTQLRNELMGLLDEVRVGLGPAEASKRFQKFYEELDRRLFVALRPYWCELIVVAIAAKGLPAVEVLTKRVREIIETVELPEGAPEPGYVALRFGLRQSWYQALAQAIAVATSREDRLELLRLIPRVRLGEKYLKMSGILDRAARIRARRLISPKLVAVPLAEFSDWKGALIGPAAFDDFLRWRRRSRPKSAAPDALAERVEGSLRFVGLHDACLAIHLWAGGRRKRWLDEAFAVLRAQPLVDRNLVDELRERAEDAVEPSPPPNGERSDEEKEALRPKIAMPSMQIPQGQLRARANGKTEAMEKDASDCREGLKAVTKSATGKADVLVLPEWSILPQLLSWLMGQAAKRQLLVVGGQTPEIVGHTYWNRLWTGIPLVDSSDHRACLVLPPRQKRFLSPHEEVEMSKHGLKGGKSSPRDVRAFGWRGMRFASLLCFEFADIDMRRRMRFEADLLTVSSLNRDWRYFDVVQDSTTRDNYCLTVCVNTGAFPGTRIVRPTKSEMAVAASVHGSDRPALILKQVDMLPIVAAQAQQESPKKVLGKYRPADGMKLKHYKPFPPVPRR